MPNILDEDQKNLFHVVHYIEAKRLGAVPLGYF